MVKAACIAGAFWCVLTAAIPAWSRNAADEAGVTLSGQEANAVNTPAEAGRPSAADSAGTAAAPPDAPPAAQWARPADTTAQHETSDIAADTIATLDKMVITATRTRRRVSETPASVSVVSKQEIESSPARNIDDLVMTKTSVNIRRVVGIGEGIPSDINMRGIPGAMAASRTLILVDGIPTNASGTPFLILNEIPMDAVERIEIVRGPYSSLYGANALGGVINVITRTGDGLPSGLGFIETGYPFTLAHEYGRENRPHGSDVFGGSADATLWNAGAQSSGGNERFNYLASGGFRRIGNYLLADSALVRSPNGMYRKSTDNHNYRDVRFFGKIGMHPVERLRIGFNARYFNSDLGFGKTKYVIPDSADIDIRGKKVLAGPEARISLADFADLRVAGYYRRVEGEYWNEERLSSTVVVPSYWKSMSNDWQVESQLFLRLGRYHTVTVGGDYLRNAIDFGATVDARTGDSLPGRAAAGGVITNAAGYIQDEILLADRKVQVVPGVRYDSHSEFNGALSPKLAAGWKIIDMLRIRGSAGRAFRAPTHSEMFMPDIPISGFILQSNKNLKPEYVWAFDAGADVWPAAGLRTTIAGFYNLMDGLIVPAVDPQTMAVTQKNTTRAWSRGIECEAEWQALSWLTATGGYTFQQTRDESATDMRKLFGKSDYLVPLDYMPDHAFDIGLGFTKRLGIVGVQASVSESYVGGRSYLEWTQVQMGPDNIRFDLVDGSYRFYISPDMISLPAYWRTDLSAVVDIGRYFRVSLTIQNLFDAQFEESGGTYAPGRFASIKFEVGQ